MADNQQNVKIPKKEKKNKTSVKLPSARKSIFRQMRMSQGKADWNGWMELAGAALVVLLILFVIFGGINQKKFFETVGEWSHTIGEKFQQIFHPDQVILDENNGVYYDVDGDGNPG